MLRALAKYGSGFLLAAGPLLTAKWSLLDWLGLSSDQRGNVALLFIEGPKDQVEMRLRIGCVLLGQALVLVTGYFDAYRPSRTLEAFRASYLGQLYKDQWKRRLHRDVRVNVMFLRWTLRRPLGRTFCWVFRQGFAAAHADAGIALKSWQGVCGRAVKKKDAVLVDFRQHPLDSSSAWQKYFWRNQQRLSHRQIKRTSGLKAVLSIPIFLEKKRDDGTEYECVGVINLDSLTDEGADDLCTRAEKLSVWFAKYGTLIAQLR